MPVDTFAPFESATAAFGVTIQKVWGESVIGLIDHATEYEKIAEVSVTNGTHVIQIETGALGELVVDETFLVVGEVTYQYRGPVAQAPSDGRVSVLAVVEASSAP